MNYENKPLDDYEKDIMNEMNDPNFNWEGDQKLLESIIASTMMESLSEQDKTYLKAKADEMGLPYPMVLVHALHLFVENDKKAKQAV